jgi:hypothetical protein
VLASWQRRINASTPPRRSQHFQALEEVEHYEQVIATGRKNWLFAGTLAAGQRTAAITSLI